MEATMQAKKTLNWQDFENQFDVSWHKWVEPIITNHKFYQDFQLLKQLGQNSKVIPSRQSNNLFRVFREVPYDKMKCVVVGLSPYNIILNNREVADGIALSCSNTGIEQPSLKQWYNAMEKEFGFGNNIVRDPDLSYLCQEGVLMYNYSLTCGWKDATGHLPVWEWFSNELFRTAISAAEVPVITLGKEAAKVLAHCVPWQKTIDLKHPASASYSKTDWDSQGAFKDVKDYLTAKGISLNWVKFKDAF